MLEDLEPLLKNLPPKTASALTQAVALCGEKLGIGPEWVRRWIGFTVVADALASHRPNGNAEFELKGGAAIEMRMRGKRQADFAASDKRDTERGIQPRATRDLDATYRGNLDDLENAIGAALHEPRCGFAFRAEIEKSDAPFGRRFRIHVAYLEMRFGHAVEKPFSNVKLDVSLYEGTPVPPDMVPAFSLKPFGIDGPECLPCLPLTKQVAQKLHAVTEIPAGMKDNDRFRDLVDLVMLSAMAPPTRGLRIACEETFRVRAMQSWPPEIVTYAHWVEPMEARAREMRLHLISAKAMVDHVQEYVRGIARAT